MFDETSDGHLLSRRTGLRGAAGVGLGAAAPAVLPACGSQSGSGAGSAATDEDLPEITTIRLMKSPLACYDAQALS